MAWPSGEESCEEVAPGNVSGEEPAQLDELVAEKEAQELPDPQEEGGEVYHYEVEPGECQDCEEDRESRDYEEESAEVAEEDEAEEDHAEFYDYDGG
ncbi:hypothetical protein MTO96_025169 [Rhipicephalus appendiculatus]